MRPNPDTYHRGEAMAAIILQHLHNVGLSFRRKQKNKMYGWSLSYLRTSIHGGFHRGHWVMCFRHFAYVGIELCTGHVIPSASLEQEIKLPVK